MRVRHVALALAVTAALTVTSVQTLVLPARAAISPTTDPSALVDAFLTSSARGQAVRLEQGVLEFESLITSAGVGDTPLAGFPTEGSTYTILTTGDATEADDLGTPDDTSRRDDDLGQDWPARPGEPVDPGDLTRLRLDVTVPDNATCLTFDYKFLTEEYGEATSRLDQFTVELLEDAQGPLSSGRQVLWANSGTDGLSPAMASGTPFDAAIDRIGAAVPIPSPRFGLTFTIADAQDGIADSAVFLDNLQAGVPIGGDCVSGAALDHHEVVLSPLRSRPAVGTRQQVAVELRDHLGPARVVSGAPLVVVRSGPHPDTQSMTSTIPSASVDWTGTTAGTDVLTACWDEDESGTCDPGELSQTRPARVTWTTGRRPRVAFTDDVDTVAAVQVTRDEADRMTSTSTTSPWTVRSEHTGEVSAMGGDLAGVSTIDEETGEVYVRADGGSWVRVTCDTFRETHPAIYAPRNLVAYASDADGDWDVYVAYRRGSFDRVPARVASSWMFRRLRGAAQAAAETSTCAGTSWVHVNVTDASSGDDLWPAWGPNGTLVWSSTTDDPLGDLYTRTVSSTGQWGGVRRITEDAAADTQPSVGQVARETYVAFTTTRYDSDGSIAALELPASTAPAEPVPAVTPLVPVWEGPTSEAAWSGRPDLPYLAWTSRNDDPVGDVRAARVGLSGGSEPIPVLRTTYPVAVSPGVAETHAAWARAIGQPDEPGTVAFTAASLPADVSDVHSEDGTDRRVLAARERLVGEDLTPRDEGAPAYTPDGSGIVYSSELTEPWPPGSTSPNAVLGHELRLMSADGQDNTSLAGQTGRRAGDTDVDPVLSHDGRRVAWTRYAGGSAPPEVWVADLDTGTARPATRSRPGWAFADVTASWSPDDRWLVVARSSTPTGPPDLPVPNRAVRVAVSPSGQPRNTVLTLLRPDGTGDSITLTLPLTGTSDGEPMVVGRNPAWSPDGDRLAYARGAQLEVVELPEPSPPEAAVTSGRWRVSSPRVLIGFDGVSAATAEPTGARAVLEAGDDPAWSPDGERLVFSGRPAGQPDLRGLYTITVEGADSDSDPLPLPLTDEPGPETDPAWQPREVDVGVTVVTTGSPALVGAPVTATFTVTNSGPGYAHAVRLTTTYSPGATTSAAAPWSGCAVDGTGCYVPVLAPGASFSYAVSVAHPAPVSGVARGVVSTSAADRVGANDAAEAPYEVVAGPASPSADVALTVAVSPTPAPVGTRLQATFTVTNRGASAAESVSLTTSVTPGGVVESVGPPAGCAADGSGCDLGTMAPGAITTYVVDLSYPAPATGEVMGAVIATTPDPDLANNSARAPLEVVEAPPLADLAVSVSLDSSTGWVGGTRTATVAVLNAGPEAAEDSVLELAFPDVVEVESTTALESVAPADSAPPCDRRRCELGRIEPGARMVWTVVLRLVGEGAGGVRATVSSETEDPELEDNAARERLTVLQPLVSVLPGVTRPGKGVLVFGEHMPPGTEVVLSWTTGLMPAPGPYAVEADGTFTEPVFVVRRDQLGKRRVVVTSTTGEFSPVKAPLLVVYPTMVALGPIEDRG